MQIDAVAPGVLHGEAVVREGVVPGGKGADFIVAVGVFPLHPVLRVLQAGPLLLDGHGIQQGTPLDAVQVVGAALQFCLHGEGHLHLLGAAPIPLHGEEGAGLGLCPIHYGGRHGAGDADAQGEARGPVRGDGVGQRVPEGVVRRQPAGDMGLPYLAGHHGGGQNHRGQALFPAHKGGEGQLGPALVEVGRAAAKVGLQAKEVGIPGVGGEHHVVLRQAGAAHLVGLLVVLVAPHIGAQGGGQGVEGQCLRQIPPLGFAGDGEQLLVGVHGLHHRAALAAPDGAGACQTLVPGEVAAGHAVVPVEPCVGLLGHGAGVLPGQAGIQRPGLKGHGQVHHVGQLGPLGLRLFQAPLPVEGLVVKALHPQGVGQVQQPVFGAALIQPVDGDEALEPPGGGPVKQGVDLDVGMEVAQGPVHGLLHPGVLGALLVDHQHLAQEEQRPHVVVGALLQGAGANPAVLLLLGQNGVDVALGPGLQVLVLQQPGQGDEPIQPIGDALPAVLIAANPAAVAYVGPDFIQVAAQAVCLNAQLAFQPALGFNLPFGKKAQLWLLEHGAFLLS